MDYVDARGEVLNRQELIDEIEKLLNRNDDKPTSFLSSEVMNVLDLQTLGAIRENLLNKVGCEVEENSDWLFGLVDKR